MCPVRLASQSQVEFPVSSEVSFLPSVLALVTLFCLSSLLSWELLPGEKLCPVFASPELADSQYSTQFDIGAASVQHSCVFQGDRVSSQWGLVRLGRGDGNLQFAL